MPSSGIVTVLFTDLVGSTQLSTSLGDEAAERLRREHFRRLRRALDSRGGEEVKSVGDGIMAVFPSAVNAVACAVSIQQGVHEQSRQGQLLQVRIGLNVGEPIAEEDDYFGTAVNVAKRLCDAAEGGQILATDLVRALVGSRGGHRFGEARPFGLKGIDDAVRACQVEWEPLTSPLPPQLVSASTRAAFVGRAREQEQIRRAWALAAEGRTRLVAIAGEPGIGKSSLAAQAARQLHAEGANVLFGRSDEEAVGAYQPFVEALRDHILSVDESRVGAWLADDTLRPLLPELTRLVPELRRRVPDLAEPARSQPETERYQLFSAVTALLSAVGRSAPTLLILDDLHWAEQASLLLLRHLLNTPEGLRLMIVGTYRETDTPPTHPLAKLLTELGRGQLLERVALSGLQEPEVGSLISHWPELDPAPGFTRAVHAETDGNPFFIEQVLRHLSERGDLGRVGEGTGGSIGVPEGVKDVIAERLARLSPECNQALEVAAVVGREFQIDLLRAVSGVPPADIPDLLQEAHSARVIREPPGVPGSFSFAHALVRDALYEGITSVRRAALHRRIGSAVEELQGDQLGPHLSELAYHFVQAVTLDRGADPAAVGKAIDYSFRAGGAAMAVFAYEEAVGYHRRALELLGTLASPDQELRAQLSLALGDALRKTGEPVQAREVFMDAVAVARELGRPELLARAVLGMAPPLPVSGYVDEEIVALLEEILDLLPVEASPMRAMVMARLAMELYYGDKPERRVELGRSAVEMAQQVSDNAALAVALSARRLATWGPENVEERLENATEMVRLAGQAGDHGLAQQGHHWRIYDLWEVGDMETAEQELQMCARLDEQYREPFYVWWTEQLRGTRAVIDGRLREAEEHIRHGFALGQRAENPTAALLYAVGMFGVRHLQGRIAELEVPFHDLSQALPRVANLKLGWLRTMQAAGRVEEAREGFDALSADDFAAVPRDQLWQMSAALLAFFCNFFGERERAARVYEMLLPIKDRFITNSRGILWFGSVQQQLGLLAETSGRIELAGQHYHAALEAHKGIKCPPWIALSQQAYGRVLSRSSDAAAAARGHDLIAAANAAGTRIGLGALRERVPVEVERP